MAPPDHERFERLVLPHLDDAYALAHYLLRDEHDAQDVVHDAVLRALRYFESYRDGDARAWLLSIVRNCCYTWRGRREVVGQGHTHGDVTLADLSDTVAADHHAIQSSDRDLVRRAIDMLPHEFREVIVLRELQELSYKEISTITGVPAGTVMSRLARARKRLAVALGLPVSEEG